MAALPKIPTRENPSFKHDAGLLCLKMYFGKPIHSKIVLFLSVEITEWGWEVETMPRNTIPQRTISAYGLGQKIIKLRGCA